MKDFNKTKPNITVFASGNGTGLQAIIDACKSDILNANVNMVISNNKNSYALERARKENIFCFYINEKDYKNPLYYNLFLLNILNANDTDIIFLSGYLRLIDKSIIEEYKDSIFNIHPSLLPKYGGKGMYGIRIHEAVINAKDCVTGITIHKVSEKFDEGEIIAQKEIKVLETDTPETLQQRVLEEEHIFIIEVLNKILKEKNEIMRLKR